MDDRAIMMAALERIATDDGYPKGIAIEAIRAAKAAKFAPVVEQRRPATIADIQYQTAVHFGLSVADLTGKDKVRHIARPRQIAMFLARALTPRSYPEIGRRFGGRDHSTVIHAERTIKALSKVDDEMARTLIHLSSKFVARGGTIG